MAMYTSFFYHLNSRRLKKLVSFQGAATVVMYGTRNLHHHIMNMRRRILPFDGIIFYKTYHSFMYCEKYSSFNNCFLTNQHKKPTPLFFFQVDNLMYKFEAALALNPVNLLQFIMLVRMNDVFLTKQYIHQIKPYDIPKFCYHHLLSVAANCRICLIEEVGTVKLIVACANAIKNKAVYFTNTALIRNVREHILEYLLINHPLDCPICDQGGECDLQDLTKTYGLDISRFFYNKKKVVIFKDWTKDFTNYFIKFKMTRCIHCTRCIRYLNEIIDISFLGVISRGFSMKITNFMNNLYNAFALGNVIDICPVAALNNNNFMYIEPRGALTAHNTEDRSRAWELLQKNTIDILDNFGSDVKVDYAGTRLYRVLPKLNQEVNDSWIADITRFSYYGLNLQRISLPYIKKDDLKLFQCLNWTEILNIYFKYYYICKFLLFKNINFSSFIGSFADAKSILSLKYLTHAFSSSNIESRIDNNTLLNFNLRQQYLLNLTKIDFNNIKCLFLIGINVRMESPLFFIKLNKNKKKFLIFYIGPSLKVDKFVQHVGINLSTFIQILKGKHYLSLYINNLNLNNTSLLYFVFGSAILQREDCVDLFNSLEYFKKITNNSTSIFYGSLPLYIGRTTSAELGVLPGISYYNNNTTLFLKNNNLFLNNLNYYFFLGNCEDYKYLNNYLNNNHLNNLSIFIGANIDSNNIFNFLLPATNFLEKATTYINVEGSVRNSNVVENNSKNEKDWLIISSLFNKLDFESKKFYFYRKNIFFDFFYVKISDNYFSKYFKWYLNKAWIVFGNDVFHLYLVERSNGLKWVHSHRYFRLPNRKYHLLTKIMDRLKTALANKDNKYINKNYLDNFKMSYRFFLKQKLLNFCLKKNLNNNNKYSYNYINFFYNRLYRVFLLLNYYFFNSKKYLLLGKIRFIGYTRMKIFNRALKAVKNKKISLMLTMKLLKVIKMKGLSLIFKNYFNLYNYSFLDSTIFFKASNISKNLQNKLIAFSSLFLIKNKYYILNNNIYFLNLKYNLNSNYLNIVYFTPITTYTRNIFETNIISRNAVEVQAIIERINNFFSNFK